jgi:hypothetical protein
MSLLLCQKKSTRIENRYAVKGKHLLLIPNHRQTKDLAVRYERALQESEMSTEKSKNRLEMTSEELERVLIQKEGESLKDSVVQGRSPGGVTGKRAIGKAVAKGGLLLKGKNPGNVGLHEMRSTPFLNVSFFHPSDSKTRG